MYKNSFVMTILRNLISCQNIHKLHSRFTSSNITIVRKLSSENKHSAVQLSYTDYKCNENEGIPILVSHGLYGSKTNWHSLCKSINRKTKKRVIAVDARNHGDSPHHPEHTYLSMVNDTIQLLDNLNLPKTVLVGHSMGGRAFMAAALKYPDRVDRLVVVDVSPKTYSDERRSVMDDYAKLMLKIPLPQGKTLSAVRRAVDEQIIPHIPEKSVRQFLLTNLVEEGDNVRWRLNLQSLSNNMDEIMHFSESLYQGLQFNRPTLFISGGNSNYVKKEDHGFIKEKFPKAEFSVIPNAGHWVHSEKPNEFLEVLNEFLLRIE